VYSAKQPFNYRLLTDIGADSFFQARVLSVPIPTRFVVYTSLISCILILNFSSDTDLFQEPG
jgi:hypothetical protein